MQNSEDHPQTAGGGAVLTREFETAVAAPGGNLLAPTLLDLMQELYRRMDNDHAVVGQPWGFIDRDTDQAVRLHRGQAACGPAADFLGISEEALEVLLSTPAGKCWLFGGEDPSEPPDSLEDDQLSNLWDDGVDETGEVREETLLGGRDADGKWIP